MCNNILILKMPFPPGLRAIHDVDSHREVIVMFCPACGAEVSDEANFCEKCGFKLKVEAEERAAQEEIQVPEVKVEVVEREKETPKKLCEMCGSADMDLVSDEGRPQLFRCPACGHYFGNFMRKGNDIYYDTTHLRIGQYIASQLVHGKFRVSVHMNHRDKGVEELADRIRQDIKNMDKKRITDALNYLLEQNVLYTYYEPTPDGEFEWLGTAFSDTPPGETEITK
jgi:uncharacterized membrane protein YvbJ